MVWVRACSCQRAWVRGKERKNGRMCVCVRVRERLCVRVGVGRCVCLCVCMRACSAVLVSVDTRGGAVWWLVWVAMVGIVCDVAERVGSALWGAAVVVVVGVAAAVVR